MVEIQGQIIEKLSVFDEICLQDMNGIRKYSGEKTKILGRVLVQHSNGVLFTKGIYDNDLLLGGRNYIAEKISNKRTGFAPVPLDVDLAINAAGDVQKTVATLKEEDIFGIMVGDAGCHETYNNILDVKITDTRVPGMVPFRVVPLVSDLTGPEREMYCMRKVDGANVIYYGKRFESYTEPKVLFEDGTEVPNNIAQLNSTKEINTYIEYKVTVSAKDIREFFLLRDGNTEKSRISSIGLLTGYPITKDGKVEFAHVRGMTTVNMNFSDLKDNQSTVTIIYRLYVK